MHSYRRAGDVWEVGFDLQRPTWRNIKQFSEETEACEYVAWLNGGAEPTSHRQYLETYMRGAVSMSDTILHVLLQGGDVEYPILLLRGCQVANRASNKDALIAICDGNDASKPLAFVGCPSMSATQFTFYPPLAATAGNSIYCGLADALTIVYCSAQGHKVRA